MKKKKEEGSTEKKKKKKGRITTKLTLMNQRFCYA